MFNDIRFALRMLLKTPLFTAVAILTLAMGIGAVSATFGVMNAYIFNPVPRESGSRLIGVSEFQTRRRETMRVSPPVFAELQQNHATFDKVAAFNFDGMNVAGAEFLDDLFGAQVTADFFDLFGTPPMLGRWINDDEKKLTAPNVIIISHNLWQTRFGGDRDIIGKQLRSRDLSSGGAKPIAYTIIGVMPESFRFPNRDTKYWRPFRFATEDLTNPDRRVQTNYHTFARLAPGASFASAQSLLDVMTERQAKAFDNDFVKDLVIEARPLRDFFVAPDLQKTLWSVALAVALVLLIVCCNLANLQLARAQSRAAEMSVRMALGAGRWRIIRQLLIESILLALAGGASGVLLANWFSRAMQMLVPDFAPTLRSVSINGPILVGTFLLAAGCGIAFGIFPALQATRATIADSLKQTGTSISAGRRQNWFRHGLVATEIAMAVVLLCSAGVMVRSVMQMLRVDPGLNPSHLARVQMKPNLLQNGDEKQRAALTAELGARLSALPGTSAVGLGTFIGRISGDYFLPGVREPIYLSSQSVGVGDRDGLRVIGARLKEGRWFDKSDALPKSNQILINESLAARCWPGQSAIGKRLYQLPDPKADDPESKSPYCEVVGVIADFSVWGPEEKSTPMLFIPDARQGSLTSEFYVRTNLDAASLLIAVQRISREVMPNTRAPSVDWVEQYLFASSATRRLFMEFLSVFAGVGLFLAMLGVFAVLTHAVIRRTKEIGVRMALGARRVDVMVMVLRQGMIVSGVGTLIGLAGAIFLTRLLRSQLFGVGPNDPLVFSAIPLLLAAVALLACWLPARRAAGVDPMVALRSE